METGTIFKFHNDLDTDQIIASQYLLLPNLDEMKGHAFESLDPDFAKKVKPGDMIVANKKFWMWFFKRTCTALPERSGRKLCDCRDICQNLLSKCNQYRTPDYRMSRSSEWY